MENENVASYRVLEKEGIMKKLEIDLLSNKYTEVLVEEKQGRSSSVSKEYGI